MVPLDLGELVAAARRLLAPTIGIQATPAKCHPHRPIAARGMCRSCYETARNKGTLDQHPTRRPQTKRDIFLADYTHLKRYGLSDHEIANRIGMTKDALAQAKRRARKAGHPL